MSVEHVVDAYLDAAQHLVGTPTTVPAASPSPINLADLPHPEWTGDAGQSVTAAGAAMSQARSQLAAAEASVATTTTTAAQINREAALQLQAIRNDWQAAKASAAATPQPLRDSTLMVAGQQKIAEAMTVISAASQRFSAAAADIRATTSGLPRDTPSSGAAPPATPSPNLPGGASPSTPSLAAEDLESALTPDAALLGFGTGPAPELPLAGPVPTAAAGFGPPLPAVMNPLQSAAPAAAPMGALTPAAAPLSSLAGLANQLHTGASTTPTDAHRNSAIPGRPGSVPAAINAALDALGITDPAARARWRSGYETLIARESAGMPDAVNRTDSNARGALQSDGAPAGSSRGLTQLIPENFQRYRVAGLSTNIYDPVSNIAASMRYVMDRYNVDTSGINLSANVQQANPRAPARGY